MAILEAKIINLLKKNQEERTKKYQEDEHLIKNRELTLKKLVIGHI